MLRCHKQLRFSFLTKSHPRDGMELSQKEQLGEMTQEFIQEMNLKRTVKAVAFVIEIRQLHTFTLCE